MAQQGLTPTEIANLETALAADGIRTGWLHRWCWRRGWALPPVAMMPLPSFLLWQVCDLAMIICAWLAVGRLLRYLPASAWKALGIIATGMIVLFVGWLLFRAICLFGKGGIAWIEMLSLSLLTAVIWTFGIVLYANYHGSTTTEPYFPWWFIGAHFVRRSFQVYGLWHNRCLNPGDTWRDYWYGATMVEAF